MRARSFAAFFKCLYVRAMFAQVKTIHYAMAVMCREENARDYNLNCTAAAAAGKNASNRYILYSHCCVLCSQYRQNIPVRVCVYVVYGCTHTSRAPRPHENQHGNKPFPMCVRVVCSLSSERFFACSMGCVFLYLAECAKFRTKLTHNFGFYYTDTLAITKHECAPNNNGPNINARIWG